VEILFYQKFRTRICHIYMKQKSYMRQKNNIMNSSKWDVTSGKK